MKRRTLTIVTFLLLGMMINVSVAWGCALWIDVQVWDATEMRLTAAQAPAFFLQPYERPGAIVVKGWPIHDLEEFFGDQWAVFAPSEPSEAGLDRWVKPLPFWGPDPFRLLLAADRRSGRIVLGDGRGWPFPSLSRIIEYDYKVDLSRRPYADSFLDAPRFAQIATARGSFGPLPKEYGDLPVSPVWRGFLLNTIIYAATTWVFWLIFRSVRLAMCEWSLRKRSAVFIATGALGALTSVMVAWACAVWIDPVSTARPWPPMSGMAHGGWTEPGANYQHWIVQRHAVTGADRVCSVWLDTDISMGLSGVFPSARPELLVPHWAPFLSPGDEHSLGLRHERIADGRGWPLLAMRSRLHRDSRISQQNGLAEVISGIPLDPLTINARNPQPTPRVLPLAPIWLGFVIDSALYWIAWILLIISPRQLLQLRGRRRLRRGLCCRCAYPIGTSDVCTECGRAVARWVKPGD